MGVENARSYEGIKKFGLYIALPAFVATLFGGFVGQGLFGIAGETLDHITDSAGNGHTAERMANGLGWLAGGYLGFRYIPWHAISKKQGYA